MTLQLDDLDLLNTPPDAVAGVPLQLPIDAVDLAADPLQVGACRRTL